MINFFSPSNDNKKSYREAKRTCDFSDEDIESIKNAQWGVGPDGIMSEECIRLLEEHKGEEYW